MHGLISRSLRLHIGKLIEDNTAVTQSPLALQWCSNKDWIFSGSLTLTYIAEKNSSLQSLHIDHISIFNFSRNDTTICIVDFTGFDHFNVTRKLVLGAEI